ncbi:MAG: DUF362 domain-containing protein [Thermoguttaceae bacterium]
MDRKEFLKSLVAAGLGSSVVTYDEISLMAQGGKDGTPDMVAVLGGEPAAMFKKGIEAFGGMGKYVKKGDRVVLKPNAAWDRTPELAANTNPELMVAVVKSCLEAGAKEVVVFDHTCDNWKKSYENSGIEKAVTEAGAKMIPADAEDYYREIDLPQGKILRKAKVHRAILDCDVWFNIPILKVHRGAKVTISMKNLMGIVWDRQVFHRNDLSQSIADINTIEKKPALNIVDAYRLMKSNGPRGLGEGDVVLTKGLFISPDPVAVDVAATKFLGQVAAMTVEEVNHIAYAKELGLGTTELNSLNIERIKL